MKWLLVVVGFANGGNGIPSVAVFDTQEGCGAALEVALEFTEEVDGILGQNAEGECRLIQDGE